MAPIDDYRLEDFDRMVAVNLRAVFVATRAAVKHMKAGSRVITLGSCNAERMPFVDGSVYGMGKAALVGLVKGMARDLGRGGRRQRSWQRIESGGSAWFRVEGWISRFPSQLSQRSLSGGGERSRRCWCSSAGNRRKILSTLARSRYRPAASGCTRTSTKR
jgi:hypothetical protein